MHGRCQPRHAVEDSGTSQILKALTGITNRLTALEAGHVHSPPAPNREEEEEEEIEGGCGDDLHMEIDAGSSFSDEESREWRPNSLALSDTTPLHATPQTSTSEVQVSQVVSTPSVAGITPGADEPGWKRYRDLLRGVYARNNSVSAPAPLASEGLGGELDERERGEAKEDKFLTLPQNSVIQTLYKGLNKIVHGGTVSTAKGRVCDDAQKWGSHVSLTSHPIRKFRPEYYRIHHDESIPEGERLHPYTAWNTSEAGDVSKGGYPADVKVRASQLRDWEMLHRAGLGVCNHLEWFLSTVWRILDVADLDEGQRTELDGLLNSSLLAVNHLCHIQGRGLTSNATVRREAILQSSTLSRSGELFLRSQPLGHPGLLGGKCDEVIARELETKQKAMVLNATVGNSGGVASTSNKGKAKPSQKFRRKTQQRQQQQQRRPAPAATATSSTPQASTPARQPFTRKVQRGKGRKLGVTASWTPKPKV